MKIDSVNFKYDASMESIVTTITVKDHFVQFEEINRELVIDGDFAHVYDSCEINGVAHVNWIMCGKRVMRDYSVVLENGEIVFNISEFVGLLWEGSEYQSVLDYSEKNWPIIAMLVREFIKWMTGVSFK